MYGAKPRVAAQYLVPINRSGQPAEQETTTMSSNRQPYYLPRPSRARSQHHYFHPAAWAAAIAVLAVLAGLGAWFSTYQYSTETSVVFTVKQLDDQASDNSHQYLIFTDVPGTHTPGEVFKDTDAIFHGKWNSSNLYSYLTAGDTYRCTVFGYRNGFLSSYRDVLVCSQISVAQARQQYASEIVRPVSS